MGERGDWPPAPAQCKKTFTDAVDPPLQEDGKCRGRLSVQRTVTRCGVRHRRDEQLAADAGHRDDRTMRFDDGWEEPGVGRYAIALSPGGDEAGLRDSVPTPLGEPQHLRLVRSGAVRRQVREREGDARRQRRGVLEHGLDRRVGKRQEDLSPLFARDPGDLRRIARRIGERIRREQARAHGARHASE